MHLLMTAPCLLGLEGLVADELKFMEAENVSAENGRVFFEGDEAMLARANINSRFAERILIVLDRFQRSALPAVEVAQQINVLRPGKPFAEPPAFERLVPLPSEIAIAVGVIDDRSGRLFDFPECLQVALVPGRQLPFDRKQPVVPLDQRELFRRISHKPVHYYSKNTKNNSIFVGETKNRKNSNSIAYV